MGSRSHYAGDGWLMPGVFGAELNPERNTAALDHQSISFSGCGSRLRRSRSEGLDFRHHQNLIGTLSHGPLTCVDPVCQTALWAARAGTDWCDKTVTSLSISTTNWHDDSYPLSRASEWSSYIFPEPCSVGCISTIDTV